MTDKNTLFTIIIITFLAGCSHEEIKTDPEKKYSPATQKEFEQIEKGEVQKQSIPPAHAIFKQQANKTSTPVVPLKKEPVEMSFDSQLSPKSQERLQEINQNLAYYCMKHRSDRSFSSEEQCNKFTKKVLNECKEKHQLINTVMVNCIKDRLKKRR